MKIPIFSNWLHWKRVKYASKFGKIEHKAGRLIAIPIIISFFHPSKLISLITFFIWIIYLTSHTIEKKIYGKHGLR